MRAYSVAATSTVALLIDADNKNRQAYIAPVGNEHVAIGGANVTYATGLIVRDPSSPIEVFVPLGEKLYCVCDTAKTETMRVLLPDAD